MVNVYVPELELVCVAPVKLILFIPTLSLTTAVKVTVWVWELVVNETLVSSAPKLVIVGFWSSVLVIVIVIVSVAVFPAASLTLNVSVSVFEPKL